MQDYLPATIKLFNYNKSLGDKTFAQLTDDQLLWQPNEASNNIATIVKHMSGNMLSRWTDFLASDGEKEWRNRDDEFESDITDRETMLEAWEKGWNCLFNAIEPLSDVDLDRVVYIRNEGHSVAEAINRQLSHYAYHVGQIVLMGKILAGDEWQSLSIPKGGSKAYNADKFAQEKERKHFTDEV